VLIGFAVCAGEAAEPARVAANIKIAWRFM
jgi:hypothetical protein